MNLGDGVVVSGRIDLIRRLDTGEVTIIDFKSTDRAQAEDVSRIQLHTYVVGYRELTGAGADLIEIHNLDNGGSIRELVDESLEVETQAMIATAAQELRAGELARRPQFSMSCKDCDLAGLCTTGRLRQREIPSEHERGCMPGQDNQECVRVLDPADLCRCTIR